MGEVNRFFQGNSTNGESDAFGRSARETCPSRVFGGFQGCDLFFDKFSQNALL